MIHQPTTIDINCDVGEGVGNEAALFPHISSCNIACGGHAGDTQSMRKIAILAHENNVKIGAHPSYPDKENFGRKVMQLSDQELQQSIRNQIDDFVKILINENLTLNHIKPHGALYNQIAKNKKLATVFLESIEDFRAHTTLYVPYASQVSEIADQRGFRIKYEAFGDRNYNDDLSLVSRRLPNAMLENPKDVFEHLFNIIEVGSVKSVTGEQIPIKADTFCIHGDTPSALEILMYLSNEFQKKGIHLNK
jgi:UPF0271 protein